MIEELWRKTFSVEMFVTIRWEKRKFGVSLSQMEGIEASKGTKQAVEDWRYWVTMGYEF